MLGLKCYQGEVNMKPKKENVRTLPFKEEDIRYVIMNPKQHNIRKYKEYRKLDEQNWIEDYGDGAIEQFTIIKNTSKKIVLKNYPVGSSSKKVYTTSFTFHPNTDGTCTLEILLDLKKGNIFRQITYLFDALTNMEEYYDNMFKKISYECSKITEPVTADK